MTALLPLKPVKTVESTVKVDAGLKPGAHLFRLEVRTADGRKSAPTTIVVNITEQGVVIGPRIPPDHRVMPVHPSEGLDPNDVRIGETIRGSRSERFPRTAPRLPRRPRPGGRNPSE